MGIRSNISPQILDDNKLKRQIFLSTAIRQSQTLPVQAAVAGQTNQFELISSGVLQYLLVSFDGTINLTGAGTGVGSTKGMYPVFPKIELVDYSGVSRINSSAFMLQQLCNTDKFNFALETPTITQPYSSKVYNKPTFAAGANAVRFSVLVPAMYSANDPRGGIIMAVPNGKCYLKVGVTSNIYGANDDNVVNGAGYTAPTLTGNITVTQYSLVPQAINGQVIMPMLDFAEVHEIIETINSSNIAANMDKPFNLPTGREFHQILQQYFNGTAGLDTNDIDKIKFIYDGNTPTLDETLQAYLTRIRLTYGDDLPTGLFLYDFREKPWDSTEWGQLQTVVHVAGGSVVNAGAYMSYVWRALYMGDQKLVGGLSGSSN